MNEQEYLQRAERPQSARLGNLPAAFQDQARTATALEMVRQLASDVAERATHIAKMVDSTVDRAVGQQPPMASGPTNGQIGTNVQLSHVDDLRASLDRIGIALNIIESQIARL